MSYQDDIIYHKILIEQQKNRIFNETVEIYNQLSKELKLISSNSNSNDNLEDIIKRSQKEIDNNFVILYKDAESQLKNIAAYELSFQNAILLNTVNYGSKKIVEKVSNELLYQTIFKDPIVGLNFIDSMSVINQSLKTDTASAIRIGILNGETVTQIRSRIQQKIGISTNKYNSFIRTAVQNVTNTATQLTYEKNKDFIERYQYIAILDNRTTDICKRLNGKIFKTGQGNNPKPPQHYNCRSFTIPIFSDSDIINTTYADFILNEDKNDKNISFDENKNFKSTNKTITIEEQRLLESKRLDRSI